MNLFRFDGDVSTTVATCRSPVPVGLRTPAAGDTVGGAVMRAQRPLRFSTLVETGSADLARNLEVAVAVPISVGGGLSTTTRPGSPPPADAEDRLLEFAQLVATAIAIGGNKAKLRASRVVATADETR